MRYAEVKSPANPIIKEVVAIRDRRSKYRHRAFIIEGTNLIEAALSSGGDLLSRVFFTEEFAGSKEGQRLLSRLEGLFSTTISSTISSTIRLFKVSEHAFKKISDTETPQGILAQASYKPQGIEEIAYRDSPLIVISDGIQEPGNIGALIRVADAAGADAFIILPGSCDAFMPKALRASAGSIFNLPIVYEEREGLIRLLAKKGIRLVVTTPHDGQGLFDSDLNIPLAFAFGNESRGISPLLNRAADLKVKIPIYGKAESLNVAATAAVCLYEAVRQRRR